MPTAAGLTTDNQATPVPYRPTIMQRMEGAGLSWHIYQGRRTDVPVDDLWSVCSYFAWCANHRFNLRYNSRMADFVHAAGAGRLPNLSLMLPLADYSQHNNRSMTVGDNYIGRMVQAVENGPDWQSTAIFVTYDDCGCFYDHVTPPEGLGIRAPMVIISPYARPSYTDSSRAVLPYSMLAFIQHNFGLSRFSKNVNRAYDYHNSFNFNQRPISKAPMTQTTISKHERKRLASLPSIEQDPT